MNKNLKDLNDLLWILCSDRITLNELNENVSEFLGFKVDFETMETETSDFRIGTNLVLDDETLAYVDIYYLKAQKGNLQVTEIGFDSDNMLNTVDFEKTIKREVE